MILAAMFEVMDKEPSIRTMIVVFSVLSVGGSFATYKRRWLAVPFIALIWAYTYGICLELRDPFVGPQMFREAGWIYILVLIGGFSASLIALVTMLFIKTQRLARLHG